MNFMMVFPFMKEPLSASVLEALYFEHVLLFIVGKNILFQFIV